MDLWWNIFCTNIKNAEKECVPRKKCGNKIVQRAFQAPITLLNKLDLKRKAFKYYKKYPSTTNYTIYTRYRNQVIWECRKAKKNKEQKVENPLE